MAERNQTLVTEFVLTGLTERPELQEPLFLVFLVIYLIIMVGSLGLIAFIWKDSHLHTTPMYLFLSSLAFDDAWTSSSLNPKMLVNFLSIDQEISLIKCFAQFYFFCSCATTECFLLVMDRYVAICNPLLYPVVMYNKLCTRLTVVTYFIGVLNSTIHVGLLIRFTFCRSNAIHYFYCEIVQLFTISCIDPTLNMLVVFICSLFIQIFTFANIVVSYIHVLFAILRKKSVKGRSKAFSTCSAHLLSVSLFYGNLFLIYICPGSGPAEDKEKLYSLFYTIIIPLLNPFMYSLRNKEVLGALRRLKKK
ncbi:olfactory receptor 5AC1-like [Microtus oregoni]|uniref:olfactory receptor 5AC1-like n=1 Tax=Microtus oregoni TaxID=111838 RepID=UPI001BB2ACEE|nr:olfactory receptor 5AC1-like [Microtus oregoni]